MRIFQKEFFRLKRAQEIVKSRFANFGVNKKQEIIRLLYEISKKDGILVDKILDSVGSFSYGQLKKYLLSRRYPLVGLEESELRPYLPKMELKADDVLSVEKRKFYPRQIFVEKNVQGSVLSGRFRELFPTADFFQIDSLKDYHCKHRNFTPNDYNHRQEKVFIVRENYDFCKRCPCTGGAVGCGYHVFNLGFGCIFECAYCFLQGYSNVSGIILPANIESFFQAFDKYQRSGMRIGTGEFSDSLSLDEYTGYSLEIIDYFRKIKKATFEFKTKSNFVTNLLKARHSGNIVISWSLNPQKIISENEFYTASLSMRLEAAQKCVSAGYKVGFHFDPVIYFPGWEKEYARVVDVLFQKIKPKDIAWISVGTFRFVPQLKQVIERRFPQNKILDEALLPGFDGKLRYPYYLRRDIYKIILGLISRHSPKLKLYLCMEERRMWKDLGLVFNGF